MILGTMKRISHKVAISIFTVLEVLGLPREGKKKERQGGWRIGEISGLLGLGWGSDHDPSVKWKLSSSL